MLSSVQVPNQPSMKMRNEVFAYVASNEPKSRCHIKHTKISLDMIDQ